ncbi:MAG TPA: hypothetical protein VNO81_10035 [Candidatus Nitrosotenuis sp.]|nr:hypothetical protein [Candidatus Nitrosotenuis sp.]
MAEEEDEELEEGWQPTLPSVYAGPDALASFLEDYREYKQARGEDLAFRWDEDEQVFRTEIGGVEVTVYLAEIDADFYGDAEALVAEAEVGPAEDDLAELLRFADEELVLTRLALGERAQGEELLVQAGLPVSRWSFELVDMMLREVASVAAELREDSELEEGDEEPERGRE